MFGSRKTSVGVGMRYKKEEDGQLKPDRHGKYDADGDRITTYSDKRGEKLDPNGKYDKDGKEVKTYKWSTNRGRGAAVLVRSTKGTFDERGNDISKPPGYERLQSEKSAPVDPRSLPHRPRDAPRPSSSQHPAASSRRTTAPGEPAVGRTLTTSEILEQDLHDGNYLYNTPPAEEPAPRFERFDSGPGWAQETGMTPILGHNPARDAYGTFDGREERSYSSTDDPLHAAFPDLSRVPEDVRKDAIKKSLHRRIISDGSVASGSSGFPPSDRPTTPDTMFPMSPEQSPPSRDHRSRSGTIHSSPESSSGRERHSKKAGHGGSSLRPETETSRRGNSKESSKDTRDSPKDVAKASKSKDTAKPKAPESKKKDKKKHSSKDKKHGSKKRTEERSPTRRGERVSSTNIQSRSSSHSSTTRHPTGGPSTGGAYEQDDIYGADG